MDNPILKSTQNAPYKIAVKVMKQEIPLKSYLSNIVTSALQCNPLPHCPFQRLYFPFIKPMLSTPLPSDPNPDRTSTLQSIYDILGFNKIPLLNYRLA